MMSSVVARMLAQRALSGPPMSTLGIKAPATGWILFLDFDGTTSPIQWLGDPHQNQEALLGSIQDAERELGCCSIVVSSAWKRYRSRAEIIAGMPEWMSSRVVGATPDVEGDQVTPGSRSEEVNGALVAMSWEGPWVALDDLAELFRQEHFPKLLVVDARKGAGADLGPRLVESARFVLRPGPDSDCSMQVYGPQAGKLRMSLGGAEKMTK